MTTPIPWQPGPRQWLALCGVLTLAAAPHLVRLPLWLAALWLLAVGSRPLLGRYGRPLPGLAFRLLVTLAVGGALLLQFGTVVGREAGSALLVMMTGLKLLELRQRRDAAVWVLLCFMLVGVQFLFAEGVGSTLYAGLVCVLIVAAWIDLGSDAPSRPVIDDLKLALRLLAQAVPVMLVLFILFPRLPGPLWSLPVDAHRGRTGLAGEMQPGSVSQLVRSDAVAFRADFAGPLPPPAQRYWRGPVFEMTDGRRWWSTAANRPTEAAADWLSLEPHGPAFHYSITLEPSGQPWLPALEFPVVVPADALRLRTLDIRATRNVDGLRRDSYVSYPEARPTQTDPAELRRNLRLPPRTSERVLALARQWRDVDAEDAQIITAALQHFHTQPFVYTLEPPLLGADPVDAFLFETRRGFCEHYAAAFTLLMRAAGIPARVVTGYQGGELNPLGDYLIVRQSDAHAWAEVWLPGQGWLRVDPTAAVAPDRIERRIDFGGTWSGDEIRFLSEASGAWLQAWGRARHALDALNNGWNQWVLGYDDERQRALLRNFGFAQAGWREFASALALGVGGVMLLLALIQLRRRPLRRDAVQTLYDRFRQRLARTGWTSPPQEGPHALQARLRDCGESWSSQAQRITELYIALRYRRQPTTNLIEDFRRAVRQFRT